VFIPRPPAPAYSDHSRHRRLEAVDRSAGEHNGRQRGEEKKDSLHGEKTPFSVKEFWSPPIPLVMEERCPLRSVRG